MHSFQTPVYDKALEARFAAAARHSRLVRILRVAVPVMVTAAMAGIVAISIFNPFRALASLPLDMDNLVVSGTKITMESPHLSGFTPDRRPYELWAKTATQDLTTPDHVDLHDMRAKVMMEDQSVIAMDARDGKFDTKAQLLNLHKDIFLQSSTGYEARLSQAAVDMGKGTVVSDEPVAVKLLNGTLDGKRMTITESGSVVRFEGGVAMTLYMDQPAQPQENGAEPPSQPALQMQEEVAPPRPALPPPLELQPQGKGAKRASANGKK